MGGLLNISVTGVIIVTLLLTHITIAAVTIYLHRAQAHRALDLHPIVSHFFRFWLWLTSGMVTKEWVAVHRKHHAKCESDEDPHSPQVLGIRKVLWQGAELYRAAAKDQQTLERYGHGTPDDWIERHLYTRRSSIGVAIMLLINILLFGPIGLTIWALQMLWIPFWAAGVINGIGHYWGYRNYETPDAGRNIVPLGLVIGGEEMHNNHHAFSSSAKFSTKWWEFDVGWAYISVLRGLGLAKVKKLAPVPQRNPIKGAVDLDTLRAVVINRLHIMSEFGREVLLPVAKEELKLADLSLRDAIRRHRRLLVRSRLSDQDENRLAGLLAASQRLATVYQFRVQLQELWSLTTASHESLLKRLQEWCTQAEASGIDALQEFARSLRCYTLNPVPVGL